MNLGRVLSARGTPCPPPPHSPLPHPPTPFSHGKAEASIRPEGRPVGFRQAHSRGFARLRWNPLSPPSREGAVTVGAPHRSGGAQHRFRGLRPRSAHSTSQHSTLSCMRERGVPVRGPRRRAEGLFQSPPPEAPAQPPGAAGGKPWAHAPPELTPGPGPGPWPRPADGAARKTRCPGWPFASLCFVQSKRWLLVLPGPTVGARGPGPPAGQGCGPPGPPGPRDLTPGHSVLGVLVPVVTWVIMMPVYQRFLFSPLIKFCKCCISKRSNFHFGKVLPGSTGFCGVAGLFLGVGEGCPGKSGQSGVSASPPPAARLSGRRSAGDPFGTEDEDAGSARLRSPRIPVLKQKGEGPRELGGCEKCVLWISFPHRWERLVRSDRHRVPPAGSLSSHTRRVAKNQPPNNHTHRPSAPWRRGRGVRRLSARSPRRLGGAFGERRRVVARAHWVLCVHGFHAAPSWAPYRTLPIHRLVRGHEGQTQR